MTDPAVPATPAAPETPEGGPLTHFEQWAARHLDPYLQDVRAELADARIKAGRASDGIQELAPLMARLGTVVQEALKLLDPAGAPAAASLLAEAEAVAAEVAKIAAEVTPVL